MTTSSSHTYRFVVAGHLDAHWSGWFGLTISHEDDGTSSLTGVMADQAQLYGVLAGLRDLGATLIAVYPLDVHVSAQRSRGADDSYRA